MIKVGITGGIGSGKTTVCRIFEFFNVPVYYADTRSKELTNTDQDLITAIKKEFGSNIYSSENKLDTKKMSEIVFKSENALKKLNNIVHPVVRKDFNSWCDFHMHEKFIILESAIIFETGLYKRLDLTITVYAPEEVRIKRIMERDGFSREKILSIMKNQLSDICKMESSDIVILDDESNSIIKQVKQLHKEINDSKHKLSKFL